MGRLGRLRRLTEIFSLRRGWRESVSPCVNEYCRLTAFERRCQRCPGLAHFERLLAEAKSSRPGRMQTLPEFLRKTLRITEPNLGAAGPSLAASMPAAARHPGQRCTGSPRLIQPGPAPLPAMPSLTL